MKFDVLGVGNALVDETFYVDKSFVDATELFFNQFKSISYQEQENILHAAVESARQKLDQARLRLAEHNKAHHGEQVD